MKETKIISGWVGNLIQGILMIVLAFIIFNNPQTVLSAIALWLGIGVAIGGVIGIIIWYNADQEERNGLNVFGSIVMVLAGLAMAFKLAITIKAITMVFGALTVILGVLILTSSIKNRAIWSLWWVVAIFGLLTIVTGMKAFFDVMYGSESISLIIGLTILFSGIGLIALALLKRKVVNAIKSKMEKHLDQQ